MKLKGLAELKALAEKVQAELDSKLETNEWNSESAQYEEKDTFLNDAWMAVDSVIESCKEVQDMKLEDYL